MDRGSAGPLATAGGKGRALCTREINSLTPVFSQRVVELTNKPQVQQLLLFLSCCFSITEQSILGVISLQPCQHTPSRPRVGL